MSGQMLLLNLLGGVALLIWATRMVRTGILRAFGERLRGLIARATRHRLAACGAGIATAATLQSSTAAALLLTSFAERGLIALAPALAVLLGADIGSTLVVQAMSFDPRPAVPVLLLAGTIVFMVSKNAIARQVGRVAIGLGLVVLALGMIVTASAPLRENWLLIEVLAHLGGEPLLALGIAAALTWLVHSSVAAVLLFISLALGGVLEAGLAFTLVLGANVGSGFIPLGVNLRAAPPVRRMLVGNLMFRTAGALAALPLVDHAAALLALVDADVARQTANAHTLFNLLLAALFLPLTGPAARFLRRLMPDPMPAPGEQKIGHLDDAALDRPNVALSGATREVMRLADTVEVMLREAILPFEQAHAARREAIKRLDSEVDRMQEEIKLYLTRLTRGPLTDAQSRQAFDLILFTTNLEHVGDIIDKTLLELAAKKHRLRVSFSEEGWSEIKRLHTLAVEQLRLAVAVFVTRDPEMARQLVLAKEQVRAIEREATESHLRRLREGTLASLETSSLHLDILRDLKRIVAHLTAVAHPILESKGELRSSRLRNAPAETVRAGSVPT
ncbi:Na/Pi cotransporter family protein [Elioraea sp. Yellowstone]|jgi:phosphate:Na+ symporter|uniref:Na/Pi cotransporter family protein n=1 Tax=Elioraea sp. Yellowstone TaxID=2592070 RepID=UPI0011544477|nr:Na/Pi cotransporter family protein [Elioraea sp. Yellowstone]TQF77016.1 Na/Pi cotransporter family protein [Elioraea sp. Yellowstone]